MENRWRWDLFFRQSRRPFRGSFLAYLRWCWWWLRGSGIYNLFFCFLFGIFRAGRLFSSLTLNFFRRGIGRPIDRANGTWRERSFSGDWLLARSRQFVRLFGGSLSNQQGCRLGGGPRRARSCGGFGSLCFRG